MNAARKKATARKTPPTREHPLTHEEAVDIYGRLEAMERAMTTFMEQFVEQTPDGPLLRAKTIGTPAAAKRGRIGLAAKRSGWTMEEWEAQFGDRTSRLSKEEMARYNSDEQNRLAALHKERPAKSPKGPRGKPKAKKG